MPCAVDRRVSGSLEGPTDVCKSEVAPASVCSSYLKRKLSQGNGECGCQVVPSNAIGGHAQKTHICNKLFVSKAGIEVSRTQKRLENGFPEDHIAPECVLGPSLLPRSIAASVQSEGPLLGVVMGLQGASLGSSWLALAVSW